MITLEINSADIRIMEVSEGKVIKWGSRPLEPGIIKEGVVVAPQALGTAVKQLMASNGIKEKKVTACIGSLYSLSRMVLVPTPLEQPVTEEAVLEVAEDVMPLSQEETYFFWQTIAPGHGGQQVLLIGVPREVIDSEVRALRAAGINPHILGLKTLALARAVNRKDALVLNIEPTSFDTIVVAGGVAELLRTSAWQPEGLSEEDRAEQLVSAIRLTVSFYDTHHPGAPFDPKTPIFITGQMSGDRALIDDIQGGIEYPIEPMSPPLEYPEHLPVSQYAVNLGLALKATTAPRMRISFTRKSRETPGNVGHMVFSIPDINLLPQIYKPWRPSARQIYASLAIVAVLSLFFPIYQVTTDAMRETALVRQRYAATNTVMQRRLAELSKREPLQKAITQYKSIVDMGGAFVDDLEAVKKEAKNLGNDAGKFIEIRTISHYGSSIIFFCEADSYSTFRDFIRALEDNGQFTTPIIPPEGYPYIKGGTITLQPKR